VRLCYVFACVFIVAGCYTTLNIINRPCFTIHIARQSHGRCFVIHKPREFVAEVMPFYFRQTKITSFQRQLNLYGFNRITKGPDRGGYYHELFMRHKAFLCKMMVRGIIFICTKSTHSLCVTTYTFHCINCTRIGFVFVSRELA
jgi:hypothetical protein